jgi:adenylate cyclase
VVGSSQLMEADEVGALACIAETFDTVIAPELARAKGRVVKTSGDGFLAEFASVVDAVSCAVAFQEEMARRSEADAVPPLAYRAGINLGDVILKDGDIFGDGVNVAARLEAMAPAGGLCISEMVWQNLRGEMSHGFRDLGPQQLKNIHRQIRVWSWPDSGAGPGAAQVPFSGPAPSVHATLRIAPLSHSSRDPEAEDFAAGLAHDLGGSLGKIGTLHLTGTRTSGARYVIDGDARTSGRRIRCNIALREPARDTMLWTERFDGNLDDMFDFQDRITEAVVSAVEIELSDGPQVRRWRAEAGSVAAYQMFQDGRAAYKEYARPANARAQRLFRQALEMAPDFLSASVGLARTHIEEAHFRWSEDKQSSLDAARDLIDGVLAIDPEHSAAHAERSHLLMISKDYAGGLLAAELAVAFDPSDADAHNCLSYLRNCAGRYEDALLSSRRAVSLNPSSPGFYLLPMVQAHIALERYDEAVGLAERILAERPLWLTTHALKAIALEGAGRHAAAATAVRDMLAINARFTIGGWKRLLHRPDDTTVPRQEALLKAAGLPE